MRSLLRNSLFIALLLALARSAGAEVPVLKMQELEESATHIFTGELKTLYRSVKRGKEYEDTRGLAEVTVGQVEKGAGLRAGQTVFLRFWNQEWIGRGAPPPGSSGHHIPGEGTRVRAYVVQGKDGTFEVLLPNGLNALKR